MKRLLAGILSLLLAVCMLFGCSEEASETTSSAPQKEEVELVLEQTLWKLEGQTEYLLFSTGKRVTAYDLSLLDGKVQEVNRYLTYTVSTDAQGIQTVSISFLKETDTTVLVYDKQTKGFKTTDSKPVALQPISVSAFVNDFSQGIKQVEKTGMDELASQSEMNALSGILCCYWNSLHEALKMHLESVLPEKEYTAFQQQTKTFESARDAAVQQAGKEVEGGSMYPAVTNGAYCTQTEQQIQTILTQYFS